MLSIEIGLAYKNLIFWFEEDVGKLDQPDLATT